MNTTSIVSAIAVCLACAAAVNTHAASDYLLPIDGIKGESSDSASKPGAQAARRAVARPSNGATSNAMGGVRVATGDVNGDSKAAAAQNANPNRVLAPAHKPPGTLLLPAVQKVREAAAK
jgi:hypothetical protein